MDLVQDDEGVFMEKFGAVDEPLQKNSIGHE